MPQIDRRLFLIATTALLGCGPDEQAQAAALQRFLQTRLLDRQGLAVPRPTDEERASFGRFSAHYDVILAFHDRMNDAVTAKLGEVVRRGSFNRAQDFVDRRADIAVAQEALSAMASAMESAAAQAQAAKATLVQPDALKATFDLAYQRVVTGPAEVMRGVLPAANDVFAQGLGFSDFLDANKSHFRFVGPTVETSRPDLLAEFNRRAQTLAATGENLLAGQRRLQLLVRGQ